MRPHHPTPNYATRHAFSLLELVLVLILIAVVAAIAVPSLRGFASAAQSEDTAEEILSLARYARARAATEATLYRLNFDDTRTQFWLTVSNGVDFEPAPEDFGQVFAVPNGAQLDVTIPSPVAANIIEFRPDGRADAAIIRLMDRSGAVTVLASLSPTEPLRRLSPQEASSL